jgi:hypothetical protein
MYRRFVVLAIAAGCALAASNAVAAPEHFRGTIASVSSDTLTVHTKAGQIVPVTLTAGTRYLKVAPSSLNDVARGAYIGTATKSIGDRLIALEVTIFPPSLKGMGEGHYAWGRMPDTTLSGAGTAPSEMTNGTVSTVSAAETVNSTMTNGTVSSAGVRGPEADRRNLQGRQAIRPRAADRADRGLPARRESRTETRCGGLHQRPEPRRHGNREYRGGRNRRCEAARVRENLLPGRPLADLPSRKPL